MAQAKKTTPTKSKSRQTAPAGKVRTSKQTAKKSVSRQKKKELIDYSLFYEIIVWIVIALDIYLFISMLGFGGALGRALSSFFFGMMGIMAYLFPFVLIFQIARLVSNHGRDKAWLKARIEVAGSVGVFITLCGIVQLILIGYNRGYHLDEYYQAGAAYHIGGGLIGGALTSFFVAGAGVVGTVLVYLIMMIISLILMTQRSALAGVKKGSEGVIRHARTNKERHRALREMWAEHKAARLEKEKALFSDPDTLYDAGDDPDESEADPMIGFSILPKQGRMAKKVAGVTTQTKLSFDLPEKTDQKSGTDILPSFVPEIKNDDRLFVPETPQQEAVPEVQEEIKESRRKKKRPSSSKEEIISDTEQVAEEISGNENTVREDYVYPDIRLLKKGDGKRSGNDQNELMETAQKLAQVFETFGVKVQITNVTKGPSVTRYELTPQMGVKVSRIVALQDDIKLNLAVTDIRIEAPIPGKAAVGIEVPNKKSSGVVLRDLLESEAFSRHKSSLAYAVGKDIAGNIIISDIAKMPHLLIAGSTGSGKSVFINTLIMSILFKASPEDVKLIMVDPKVVELSVYNGIPHLFIPVVTDPKKAAGALNWAVTEMMTRYQKFAECGVRDLKGYNAKVTHLGDDVPEETRPGKMPQIVIIVDELADLMMVASSEVEDAICRLAQLARAAGIHLVIATQRPSVDVITGLIKANMPSRIAFMVTSGVDSRTILDQNGAEKLLGNGDMLFAPSNYKQPLRVQGAYVSEEEVAAVVDDIKEHNNAHASDENLQKQIEEVEKASLTAAAAQGGDGRDELFEQAARFIIEKDKASIGMLQRWFRIGFNRAARIMDQLSDAGVVGPEEGTKPRKVEMSMEQLENFLEAGE